MKRKNIFIIFALGVTIAVFGHACGEFKKPSKDLGSAAACDGAQELKAVPGERMVAITYGSQTLDNMVACTGLQRPSDRTREEYETRKSSFSEYGRPSDVTAPLMMGVAALAIEVCSDLVDQENAAAPSERRIFNAIANFDDQGIDVPAAEETIRRMARSCWGRNENEEEREEIKQSISDMETVSTRHVAITICTGILASLDGISM